MSPRHNAQPVMAKDRWFRQMSLDLLAFAGKIVGKCNFHRITSPESSFLARIFKFAEDSEDSGPVFTTKEKIKNPAKYLCGGAISTLLYLLRQ
jgi:hypothetical protein